MHPDRLRGACGVVLFLVTLPASAGAPTVIPVTRAHPALISDTAIGVHGPDSAISADGRYVAIVSNGINLVAGFVGAGPYSIRQNVYLLDRSSGGVHLVTHDAADPLKSGDGHSTLPVLSADGRYLAFVSQAGNLIAGQSGDAYTNVFLFDRQTGTTTLVSHKSGAPLEAVGSSGSRPLLSVDGAAVAFDSDATNVVLGQADVPYTDDVFVYSVSSGQTRLASRAATGPTSTSNRDAELDSLSADGTLVVFTSDSTNFVSGQLDFNGARDVFVFDSVTGSVTLVSHTQALPLATGNGTSSRGRISADGSAVAMLSTSTDLVAGQTSVYPYLNQLYLADTAGGATRLVSHSTSSPTASSSSAPSNPHISGDGASIAYESSASDLVSPSPNSGRNVYVFDAASGVNALVSAGTVVGGVGGELASLTEDGRYVAYASQGNPGFIDTNDSYDVFVYDRSDSSTRLVSAKAGAPDTTANAGSTDPALAPDAQHVVFFSGATNLVSGLVDQNLAPDLYVHDSAQVLCLSRRDPAAPAAMSQSGGALGSLSDDGRYVVFHSSSRDLVPGFTPTNYGDDVFLFDRASTNVTLVSHTPGAPTTGASGGNEMISSDGRWIAFVSSGVLIPGLSGPTFVEKVYLRDRVTGAIVLASHAAGSPTVVAGGESYPLALSQDGRYVVFASMAPDLVPGDTGFDRDLFLYDRQTDNTLLVTHVPGNTSTPVGSVFFGDAAISADGRYVAFTHDATNLVVGQIDTNSQRNLFLFDRVSGSSILVDRVAGTSATTSWSYAELLGLSGDGNWVALLSGADNLVAGQIDDDTTNDVFLFERATGTMRLVSHATGLPATAANYSSGQAALSRDGRWVAFASYASNLVAGVNETQYTSDVFIYDRTTGNSVLVSHAAPSSQTPASGHSLGPSVAADGSVVAYVSDATDLVSGVDTPNTRDAFRFSRSTGVNTLVSHRHSSSTQAAGSAGPTALVSANGSSVVFESNSDLVAPDDLNAQEDVFLYTSLHVKGDLNDDLNTDLLLRNVGQPVNRVWTLDGDANRVAEVDVTPDQSSVNWELVASDDFNADLHSDLVFRNRMTGAVEFWLMNGTARQGAPVPFGPPTPLPALNWQLAATADFNSDGKPDLLWRNTVTQQLQIWTLSGTSATGTITPSPAAAIAANWEVVAALDLDLDGNTDLLWYNTTSGRVVRWLMNAQVQRLVGEFTNPMQAGNNNWKVLAGGDYGVGPAGLPGTRDLVWRNATSGNYVIWHMDTLGNRTSGRFTNPAAPASALSWTIAGPR